MSTVSTFIALTLLFGLRLTSCTPRYPKVKLDQGEVMGILKESKDRSFKWQEYKDIPYGAAPVGNLRWRPPQPHGGWEGTLDATKGRKICPQPIKLQFPTYGNQTEDCLRLDVYVPKGRAYNGRKLPVMIFIHGGGFFWGEKTTMPGAGLSQNGVIVVVIGYRLGVLGFLSFGDDTAMGNWGLRDQRLAIQWVKHNIEKFGGDSEKISIFGSSAGAVSVVLQMISPHNRGSDLFQRVIAESGSAFTFVDRAGHTKKSSFEVAAMLNCTAPGRGNEDILNCLQGQKLIDIRHVDVANSVFGNLAFYPVLDGDFVMPNLEDIYAEAKDVDFMTGTNQAEGYMLSRTFPFFVDLGPSQCLKLQNPAAVDPTFEFQYSNLIETYDPSNIASLIGETDLFTDSFFSAPCERDAYLHARSSDKGKTYRYWFHYKPSFSLISSDPPSWVQGTHADELGLVLRYPHFNDELAHLFFGANYTSEQDRHVSDLMARMWTNFARTGDPNNGEPLPGFNWPAYTADVPNVLEINPNLPDSGVANVFTAENAPEKLRPRQLKFWNDLIPKLEAALKSCPV